MGAWADAFQVCVFDMRRGQQEGHELDKILFFSPADWPLPSQLSVVGLSEGLITFTRIFSPDAPCEVMDAERHVHVFFQCEPHIWMVMVIEKGRGTHEPTRYVALKAVLEEAHHLFQLFFGPLRELLDKHPAGDVARCCLHSLLPDYFSDFQLGKKLRLPSSADCLTERGMVDRFPLLPDALLESQALVGMMQSWGQGDSILHALIVSHDQLVASTLSPGDTSAVFAYASLRMRPSAVYRATSNIKNNTLPSLYRSASVTQMKSKAQSDASGARKSDGRNDVSRNASSVSDQSSIPKPLQRDAWWRGSGEFLCTSVWGTDSDGEQSLPIIWLKESGDRMRLFAYQYKSLTFLLLIPADSSHDGVNHMKKQFLEQASQKVRGLEDRLAKEWGGPNASHIPSYRYLYFNSNLKMAQSSPAGKVTTLAKDTLTALSRIRAEVDAEKARLARRNPHCELEFEISMRTKNNAWVVARTRNGHELYTALEKTGDTLLLASDAMELLSERYFDGRFASG